MAWPLYDNFAVKANTYDGNIGYLQTGTVWDVRGSYSGENLPPTIHGQIRNGALVSDDMSTIYATQSPTFIPAQMGALISWLPGNGGTLAGSVTLATCKTDKYVMEMGAHLTIIPTGWYFWVRDASGFDMVASGAINPICRIDGTAYGVGYSIIENNIYIEVCGRRYSYSNDRIKQNNGPYCFWEIYYHDKIKTSAMSQINKIWAGPAEASCTTGRLQVIG